eukprot:1817145-Lingulodinium_polyedra.AAC.1
MRRVASSMCAISEFGTGGREPASIFAAFATLPFLGGIPPGGGGAGHGRRRRRSGGGRRRCPFVV